MADRIEEKKCQLQKLTEQQDSDKERDQVARLHKQYMKEVLRRDRLQQNVVAVDLKDEASLRNNQTSELLDFCDEIKTCYEDCVQKVEEYSSTQHSV